VNSGRDVRLVLQFNVGIARSKHPLNLLRSTAITTQRILFKNTAIKTYRVAYWWWWSSSVGSVVDCI